MIYVLFKHKITNIGFETIALDWAEAHSNLLEALDPFITTLPNGMHIKQEKVSHRLVDESYATDKGAFVVPITEYLGNIDEWVIHSSHELDDEGL